KRLLDAGQILESPAATAPAALKLEGIVMDDAQAAKSGQWTPSSASARFLGAGYLHDGNTHDGKSTATFKVPVPAPGAYRVRLVYPPNPNRATNTPVTVESDQGAATVRINQRKDAEWLGPYRVSKALTITIANRDTDGFVVVDGVQVMK
ncbi:MAG: xly 2, partial [Candidatus Solibacter sp.]|nr:xly 2 [Candidatus Solibacter sp.]